MEKKKIKRYFNLVMVAGCSKFEDSGIGPNLSPFMNKEKITKFCNEFNILSKNYKNSLPIRVFLCLFFDNTFFFIIKGASATLLLKLILNIEKLPSQMNSISVVDFFFLLFLKTNLIDFNIKKLLNKHFFYSLLSTLNSTKFLTIINDVN